MTAAAPTTPAMTIERRIPGRTLALARCVHERRKMVPPRGIPTQRKEDASPHRLSPYCTRCTKKCNECRISRFYTGSVEKARPDVQAQRRAATRERIVRAGTRLFETRGYADTSIADISAEAGVAARTIYLHFESKSAILLAYFDDWLGDFVAAVCQGSPDEALEDAVVRAYGVVDAAGKLDHRTFDQIGVPHPAIELFASSNLDIPGHVLQTWVRAQDALTDHFARASTGDRAAARTKASAFFATWMVTLLTYRDSRESDAQQGSLGPMHDVAIDTVRRFGAGVDHPPA